MHACRLMRGGLSRGCGWAYQTAVGDWCAMCTRNRSRGLAGQEVALPRLRLRVVVGEGK